MLDDIQVGYYDSKVDRVMRASTASDHEAELNLGQEPVTVLRDIYSSMKKRLNLVKHRFNLTIDGVHVQQRVTGCEVLEDGQPALIMFRDGSNGQDADSLLYNMTHFTYAVREGWEIQWDALKKTSFQMLYSNIYLPFCVRTLQHFLEREKHLVMRRVKPRLRFITRQVVGGAQVTCLATDFYPRHINLSLLRDGQPVDEGELRIGSVLPNGNGLYQVRKTLMVDEKELQRKHNYTCEASHLSLDNRLRVNWRAESSYSQSSFHLASGLPAARCRPAAAGAEEEEKEEEGEVRGRGHRNTGAGGRERAVRRPRDVTLCGIRITFMGVP